MDIFFNILIMMLLVSISGLAKRIIPCQFPLPLLQIALGACMAWPNYGLHIDFNSELFFVLFVPPLLFVDGWKIPTSEFMNHGREIILLALALVLMNVIGIGYLSYLIVPHMKFLPALCLAAVLSPTDAVALSGMIGEGRIPKKIMTILQGEALMNDASGLIALKFAVAVAIGGTISFTFYGALMEFSKLFLGGILSGIIITWIYSKLIRLMNKLNYDPVTQIILLLLLPFASSLIADSIAFSGILAAVAAGMTVHHTGIIHNAPLTMRLRANNVWSMLEFIFNGMVFILFGIQLPKIIINYIAHSEIKNYVNCWLLVIDVITIYFSLLVVRFGWLLTMQSISHRFMKKYPIEFEKYTLRELLIISFAGVRGTITLAGVLSIPHFINVNNIFPAREGLIFVATGVILFSLFISIIILPILLHEVSLDRKRTVDKIELEQARSIMARVAIESINKMENRLVYDTKENIDSDLLREVSSRVIGSMRQRLDDKKMVIADNVERRFRITGLRAERGEVYHLRATKKISDETMQKLLYELDLLEALLIEKE
ncbi:MAG: Na+/H+ antiporter [Candidatus Dasytiphilus stammeri]